jgi:hypothetical protein
MIAGLILFIVTIAVLCALGIYHVVALGLGIIFSGIVVKIFAGILATLFGLFMFLLLWIVIVGALMGGR